MRRWIQRPSDSTWGDWGQDDELGRLNLLTSRKVRQGIAEVRAGLAFCLSLPLDLPTQSLNPRRFPPRIRPTSDENGPRYNYPTSHIDPRFVDVISDDLAELTLQHSSHWDSLAHIGAFFDVDGSGVEKAVYYNGYRAGTDIQGPDDLGGRASSYAHKLSVANLAQQPIQGRGVLIDLHRRYGNSRERVNFSMLSEVMADEAIVIEPGDMLLIHTGFATGLVRKPTDFVDDSYCVLDGSDPALLSWITTSQVAAICADNYAVEDRHSAATDRGAERQPFLPLHHHCLFKLGVVLGEMWYLGELAAWLHANKRSRFLLTAPPLRLPGAVGSPASPIATV